MEFYLLSSLPNTTTQWKPFIITYLLAMPVSGIWIYVDSSMRTGNSCFWASLAFACPFIGVPLYYIVILTTEIQNSRGPGRQEREERERMETQRKQFVMQGAIEREKKYHKAMQGGGTVFDPASGMGKQSDGFKYYTDHRAEELIETKNFSGAKEYLEEMLHLARKENDNERIETCSYYLKQLPKS